MPTTTLLPTANGSLQQWGGLVGSATGWQAVAAISDAEYIGRLNGDGAGTLRFGFALADLPVTARRVISAKVQTRQRFVGVSVSTSSITYVRSGGVNVAAANSYPLTGAFAAYTDDFSSTLTTVALVNAAEIGAAGGQPSGADELRCSYLGLDVEWAYAASPIGFLLAVLLPLLPAGALIDTTPAQLRAAVVRASCGIHRLSVAESAEGLAELRGYRFPKTFTLT